jgi:hypothetical protein
VLTSDGRLFTLRHDQPHDMSKPIWFSTGVDGDRRTLAYLLTLGLQPALSGP